MKCIIIEKTFDISTILWVKAQTEIVLAQQRQFGNNFADFTFR